MTELIPLAQSATDDFEKELIQSARTDAPARGAKLKLMAAFGGGAAAVAATGAAQAAVTSGAAKVVATSGASAAAAGTAAAGQGAIATGVGKVATLSLVKWLGAGALAGTVLSTGATAVLPIRTTATEVHAAPAVAAAEATAAAGPIQKSPAPTQLADVPPPEVTDDPAAAEAAFPAASAGARSNVVDELKLLDDARKAVASGNSKAALAALDARDRKHGDGALGPEADVLRVEALFAAGQKQAAASRAQRFLRQHPSSPHAGRVRTLLSRLRAQKRSAKPSVAEPKLQPSTASTSSRASFGEPSGGATPSGTKSAPSTASFPTP